MNMAQFTQKAIIQAFRDMLEDTPFDKITVSSIIAKCGISSNTFYYHFRDIYDLLDSWLQEEKEQFINNSTQRETWQDIMKTKLNYVKENQSIAENVLNSLSRGRLERYIFEFTDESIYKAVCREAEGRRVPEERLRDIADFCWYAVLGFFLKYLWNHMSFDIDKSVDRLSVLFKGFVRQAIDDCPDKQ
jgi:AcrR family transcriptional regulator